MLSEEFLCIIPAKGTSNRLKRKNIAMLNGKPLIAYAIDAAKKTGIFKEIFVSTEDDEIKRIAEDYGAIVPYIRPEYLSKDPAGVVEVCLHMINYLEGIGKFYKTLFILLPTSPLRTDADIISALNNFATSDAKVLMSVSEYMHTPFAALKADDRGYLSPYFPKLINLKSQKMPKAYICNGAVTILDITEFKMQKNYHFYPMASYIMPWERSIDVDNEIDLKFAEFIMKVGTE
ncbi:acylneuraminate cytidylyltransferase family protein [Candidatus Kuenenia sp.]|uniref:acylneuraminate cytidylyltransferase family protein n=1 Tax=Candidatus Kuenenia sp. TaxID=2499824 RepID=UPI003220067F